MLKFFKDSFLLRFNNLISKNKDSMLYNNILSIFKNFEI